MEKEQLQARIEQLEATNKKLVWALKHIKPATRNIDPNAWDTITKAIIEAEKKP